MEAVDYGAKLPETNETNEAGVLGTGAYFGWIFVFAIPVIGWIICLIMALTSKNKNLKHYALAKFIWATIGLMCWIGMFFFVRWVGRTVLNEINETTGMQFESFTEVYEKVNQLKNLSENFSDLQGLTNLEDFSDLENLSGLQELLNPENLSKVQEFFNAEDLSGLQELLNSQDLSGLKQLLESQDSAELKQFFESQDMDELQEILGSHDSDSLKKFIESQDPDELQKLLDTDGFSELKKYIESQN